MDPNKNNKKIAVEFLTSVVAGRIDEAYEKYADKNCKHHNAFFPAGLENLKNAMKENEKEFPNKKLIVKNVLGDDDLVAVHSHLILKPHEMEMTVVHLFRIKNAKIVEMWDCGQAIPKNCPNEDGVF